MKLLGYSLVLSVFWFFLSGITKPLILGLGLASVFLTLYLAKRMDVIDHESYPLHIKKKFPGFFLYIMWEIVKANVGVIKAVLGGGEKAISPKMVDIPVPQNTDLGRVIYANSITLTPGTVSVELTQDNVRVHALTAETAADLETGEMAKHIPDVEPK